MAHRVRADADRALNARADSQPQRQPATVSSIPLLNGISLAPGTLRVVLLDRLTRSLGKHPDTATQRDVYDALSLAVREELAARWLATQRRVSQAGVKRVCYLSVEFLLGRTLVNGLSALDGEPQSWRSLVAHRRPLLVPMLAPQ